MQALGKLYKSVSCPDSIPSNFVLLCLLAAFGAASSSAFGFGAAPASTPAFGGFGAASTGGFGAPASTPAFGGFGATPASTPAFGGFGAASAPAASSSAFSFSEWLPCAVHSSTVFLLTQSRLAFCCCNYHVLVHDLPCPAPLFPAAPAATGFGAPATSASPFGAPASSGSLFGASSTPAFGAAGGTSLFGGAAAKPATPFGERGSVRAVWMPAERCDFLG